MTQEQDCFYQSLITEYYPAILHYVSGMVHDPKTAEELAFDTFHEAFMQIEDLMAHEAPKLWLFRTAKNKTMNFCSKRNREARRSISVDRDVMEEQLLSTNDEIVASTLMTAMEQVLSPEDFRLFVLHSRGMPFENLARQFGCTAAACRKRVQRIREKLRRELF